MIDNNLCVFGEVLFDHFPDGQRVLGGAPFNVAWHLQAFGQAPHFISRVGEDADGESIRRAMRDWGMAMDNLQHDPRLPTGRVSVTIEDGEPSYDIVHPCAYDAIETPGCGRPGLLYHGSLALRDAQSRRSLEQLVANQPETVFVDVNLRPPWWDKTRVTRLMEQADWVKLNADELALLYPNVASPRSLIDKLGLRGILLTHGSRGAETITATGEQHHVTPTPSGQVVDTVGAGDSFAAVFILGLLQQWPLSTTLQRAQQFASAIVGQRGATVSDKAFYQSFIDEWI
ncbi:MAG: carbohydrate kinase [Gammaproteobacteria bacterium]|nr:carbohydrate kinase [Gammaproteobacteria bacterium]